jgi:hypothetical protein
MTFLTRTEVRHEANLGYFADPLLETLVGRRRA